MKSMSRYAPITFTAVITFGIAVSLGGCSSDTTDAGTDGGSSPIEQAVTTSGTTTTPDADDATNAQDIVDEDGEVPDWLAEGFPLYPGSRVAASGESGDLIIISFSVPNAEQQEIYEWFVEQYSVNGWEASYIDDEHGSFEADNADGRTASINVTKSTFVISASQG